MNLGWIIWILVITLVLVVTPSVEAKRRQHIKHEGESHKTKTKTKWSTSVDLGPSTSNAMVATEEHGYYVKRTYLPTNESIIRKLQSPPYLGIPIAWFNCAGGNCNQGNSNGINSHANALSEGFLCDDDCVEPYEPICGKTHSEVAVFYNKCKLNVAKCRTHGLWQDFDYIECQKTYAKQTEYADKKFRASPFFRGNATMPIEELTNTEPQKEDNAEKLKPHMEQANNNARLETPNLVETRKSSTKEKLDNNHLKVAISALDEISSKLTEAEETDKAIELKLKQNPNLRSKYVIAH